jgi:hypothetical protein
MKESKEFYRIAKRRIYPFFSWLQRHQMPPNRCDIERMKSGDNCRIPREEAAHPKENKPSLTLILPDVRHRSGVASFLLQAAYFHYKHTACIPPVGLH